MSRPCLIALTLGPDRRSVLSRRHERDWWIPCRYDARRGEWILTTPLAPPTVFADVDEARAVMQGIAGQHTSAFRRRLMIVDAFAGEPIEMGAAS